jgi:hypothetical protein
VKPLVILGAKSFPLDKELIAAAMWARVDDVVDFVFLQSIWCKDRSGVSMLSRRKQHRIIWDVKFELWRNPQGQQAVPECRKTKQDEF